MITTPPVASTPTSYVNTKQVSATGLAGSFGGSSCNSSTSVPVTAPAPPHDEGRPRARSIEEVDRDRERMYVPIVDKLFQSSRKASATPSQFSLLSVSCRYIFIHLYSFSNTLYRLHIRMHANTYCICSTCICVPWHVIAK